MKEEDKILRKVGTGNAFKVPENYFEGLTAEVMSKLPEKEKVLVAKKEVGRWTKLKPLLYMAAMFVGAALIIKVASTEFNSPMPNAIVDVNGLEGISDQYISEAVNGSMMDDYSLYVYLSDSNAE